MLKLFLIDDDTRILDLYTKMLRKNGYFTLSASSASDALEIIDRGLTQIDLIISDINMPELNGFELFQQVEMRHPELAKKIIFITGGIIDETLRDFALSIPNLMLNKPIGTAKLLRAVSGLVHFPEVI